MNLKSYLIHKLGGYLLEELFQPRLNIRTATIMTFWTFGHPGIGQIIFVPMQSGLTGIYEVTDIVRAIGVDWDWIDLTFRGYKDEPKLEIETIIRKKP